MSCANHSHLSGTPINKAHQEAHVKKIMEPYLVVYSFNQFQNLRLIEWLKW
jgi:hypothetical protein